MARALVDAGYMPLSRYIEIYGADDRGDGKQQKPYSRGQRNAPRLHPVARKAPGHRRHVRHAA
jgi:hypothetical protein